MAESILIRNLKPGTKAALRRRADRNHTTMEAEARSLVESVLEGDGMASFVEGWLTVNNAFRGGPDLELPEPAEPRPVDDLFS
ncbi:hypothetical protein [uncultured Nocardioides sp.]|uniref:FitA-like ribbon-helix-helix domain-containing protein n=1 Tax=uncultured Nocardioides sp. TaxID=198441 RepID=UPI00261B41B6|nr:hypothetical protein [uncultured Nocardioides sp.]HRD63204.1 hypothetical protein [Nocardioides sp.]